MVKQNRLVLCSRFYIWVEKWTFNELCVSAEQTGGDRGAENLVEDKAT